MQSQVQVQSRPGIFARLRRDELEYGGLLLILPALLVLLLLYVAPLGLSVYRSFVTDWGEFTTEYYQKAFDLYFEDMLYTVGITTVVLACVFVISVTLASYLRFVDWPLLNFLYRIPLFIPFLIVGHAMRVFLAPHGTMNLLLAWILGVDELPGMAFHWSGLVLSYVWKQFPFVTLLMLGAFKSIDDSYIEAAHNLGAGKLRVVFQVLLPMARPTVLVGLVLTYVTTMSVLTIPLLVGPPRPVMLPVDMAYRVTYFNDWGTANALGVVSYLLVIAVAYYYLRHLVKEN